MSLTAKSIRRAFGTFCLLAALAMLVAGETWLKGRLSPAGFLFYWLGCFGFTVLAICAALLDAARVRAECRHQQRALFEEALREVERKKRNR